MRLDERKRLYTHVTTSLERCSGCNGVVGGETITIADGETGQIVRCPECKPKGIL